MSIRKQFGLFWFQPILTLIFSDFDQYDLFGLFGFGVDDRVKILDVFDRYWILNVFFPQDFQVWKGRTFPDQFKLFGIEVTYYWNWKKCVLHKWQTQQSLKKFCNIGLKVWDMQKETDTGARKKKEKERDISKRVKRRGKGKRE